MKWAIIVGIIWSGPKLTPIELADILRPNQFHLIESNEEPRYIIVDTTIPYPNIYTTYYGNNTYAYYIETRVRKAQVERRNIQSIKKIGDIQKKSKRLHD